MTLFCETLIKEVILTAIEMGVNIYTELFMPSCECSRNLFHQPSPVTNCPLLWIGFSELLLSTKW
jgi:hypothetical protein